MLLQGVSGAGKTTLLDVLATRVSIGVVSGDTLINGVPTDATFQHQVGYVQQQDIHLSTMTVREALEFSAVLRQSSEVPRKERLQYVDHVIEMLEMEDFAGAVIGVPGEGLNVEQRKRLTIGVELAARPQLLVFFDEPTSGLDSQTSWAISVLIRKLANSGQAVLCTIHQPSAILFDQFDRLLLIAPGGKTVFFGGKLIIALFSTEKADNYPQTWERTLPSLLITSREMARQPSLLMPTLLSGYSKSSSHPMMIPMALTGIRHGVILQSIKTSRRSCRI